MRHLSVANDPLYVTTSSGKLLVLGARDDKPFFTDQTIDLNVPFNLGLNKPHSAGMNGGALSRTNTVSIQAGPGFGART
jgi:hypothetical protein